MPSYTRGKTRDTLKFVKANGGNIYYGFKPKDLSSIPGVSQADVTALGHKLVGEIPSGGYAVIGANNPKPQRAKKTLIKNPNASQQASVSTFVGADSIVAAQTAGWELVGFGRMARISNKTGRGSTVGAEIDATGGLYLFFMNQADITAYASLLGLLLPSEISAAERAFAFSGATRPRPAKMGKVVDQATNATFSSFVTFNKEDEALAAGFEYILPAILGPKPAAPTTP